MAFSGSFNKTHSESKEDSSSSSSDSASLPQIERGLVFPHDKSAVSIDVSKLCGLEPNILLPEVPEVVEQLILDYLPVNDTDDAFDNFSLLQELPNSEDLYSSSNIPKVTMASFYRRDLTLFGNLAGVKAIEAAYEVVADNAYAVEKLLAKNPSICFCIVRVKDHDGNWLEGNLLQIAAMTGNFNPRQPNVLEAHYGLFEKLSFYYPPEEVAKVAAAVNSPEWQAETARRMQPFMDAFDELMRNFIDAGTDQLGFAPLKKRYELAIEKFKDKLIPNPNQVIRFGYVFDLKVIADALEKAVTNINVLGGWSKYKIDVICVVGAGSFQKKASRCDARIIKRGVHPVVDQGALPDRTSNLNENNSYHVVESYDARRSFYLGVDFVWDIDGRAAAFRTPRLLGCLGVCRDGVAFTKLMSSKNISAQQIYAATRRAIESVLRDNVNLRNSS